MLRKGKRSHAPARHATPVGDELPARLRQTLDHLLAGQSEKQIAVALGLSRHTVHHHVKTLYRRFGVSSRAELMARWISRTGVPNPPSETCGNGDTGPYRPVDG